MSCLEDNLTLGEKILYKGKIHWTVYIPSIAFCFGGAVLVLLLLLVTDFILIWFCAAFLLLCAMTCFIEAFLFRHSTEIVLTTSRIMFCTGFVHTEYEEIYLQDIADNYIHWRIFHDAGDVVVITTDGELSTIPEISEPGVFLDKIEESREKHR